MHSAHWRGQQASSAHTSARIEGQENTAEEVTILLIIQKSNDSGLCQGDMSNTKSQPGAK